MSEYKCTGGHDRCDQMYPSSECPYCVKVIKSKYKITKILLSLSFLILVMFSTQKVFAEENKNGLEILCCSWHHDREADYNEINPGIFYMRDFNERRDFVVGGVFQNSLDNTSFVLGVGREWEVSEDWDFRLIVGLVTGYSEEYAIVPGAIPSFVYRDTLSLQVIPGVVYSVGFKILEW